MARKIIVSKSGNFGFLEGTNISHTSIEFTKEGKPDPTEEEFYVEGMPHDEWEKWKEKPELKHIRKFSNKKLDKLKK